jgi:DNA-binding transcriptional ArsR family regulator
VALADPTRRKLYERLRHGERTVTSLAEHLGVSQPAVSQHLSVLSQARLVSHRCEGTRRYYQARQEGLVELRHYVESLWDDVLAAYAASGPPSTPLPKSTRKSLSKRKRS